MLVIVLVIVQIPFCVIVVVERLLSPRALFEWHTFASVRKVHNLYEAASSQFKRTRDPNTNYILGSQLYSLTFARLYVQPIEFC